MGRERTAQLAAQLQELRNQAGNPSFRKMAGTSGQISHTTLHEAAIGSRFPSWETTREFVRVCGGDEREWRVRWEQARCDDDPSPEEAIPSTELGESGVEHVEKKTSWFTRRWVVAITGVAAVIFGAVIILQMTGAKEPSSAANSPASPPPSSGPLIAGDASKFIADVTIPDGTAVKVNERFVKVWAIQNTGSVAWQNRYLQPQHARENGNACSTPDRVLIGDTAPGERVMVSVSVVAPSAPGTCWVSWKMVDEQGRQFFTNSRPVYFLVNVVN